MENDQFAKIMFVQHHQINTGRQVLDTGAAALGDLQSSLQDVSSRASNIDNLLAEADNLLASLENSNVQYDSNLCDARALFEADKLLAKSARIEKPTFEKLEMIDFDASDGLEELFSKHADYALRHNVNLNGNLSSLLGREGLALLKKRIDDDFTYKNAKCDTYDYMIAGTAGILGAIVDIFFIGAPGEGFLTKVTDKAVDKAVVNFASFVGWKGPRDGKDPFKSAIAFLERKYKVNYDHRHGGDVGGVFPMSTKNHHIKSMAHWPDLIGLFFSILDQFTSSAHFVHNGELIVISTERFTLSGGNFITKILAGFVNWLGHLFSDVAGSAGAQGRGSGIPIPFFGLTQFLDVGEFGQYRQTFATVCTQVFEQGYDFRHGLAMATPVAVTELLVRFMFFVKQHFYHKKTRSESLPNASIPELRRMLLVGHGTLCLFDAGDAALRSGGDMIQFLLRTNMIAWVRFGSLALKELIALVHQGRIDAEKLDIYIEQEYNKILAS